MADMDNEWELSKENIKPLKTGRRIGNIALALNQESVKIKSNTEEFEMQLRVLEGEELMDMWYKYISWMEQHCLSRSHELLNLMKRCIVHFKDNAELKNNEKYVKIWIKISEEIDDAEDIFNYMFDHDIGTSLALFYHSWADYFELIECTKKSDEIYQLGINRNATPVETLQNSHREFERRMLKKVLKDDGSKNTPSPRSPLSSLKATKSGKVSSERVKIKSKSKSLTGVPISQPRSSSTSSIEVFCDDKPTFSLPIPTGGTQKELPFSAVKNKENTRPLEKVRGAKLKKSYNPSNSASFKIYEDAEVNTTDLPQPICFNSRKPLSCKVLESSVYMFEELEQDSASQKTVFMYEKKIYMGVSEVSLEELKAQLPTYSKCRGHNE